MSQNKSLFFFTHQYPFGNGESFIKGELETLSQGYTDIYVFPLTTGENPRKLPANAKVILPAGLSSKVDFSLKLRLLFFYLGQWIKSGFHLQYLKKSRYFMASLVQFHKRAEQVANMLPSVKGDVTCYSFWGDDWATVLALLKKRNKIHSFTMRLHGFDLYNERWPGGLIPFRYFQLSQQPEIIFVSASGLKYFQQKHANYKNTSVKYLRADDHGTAAFPPSGTVIVSCSNVIDIKRVDFMVDALKLIAHPVKWIHVGDGPMMETLKEKCKELPSHISYELKGSMEHAELIKLYKTTGANVFVHLSQSEGGVPLVLQEAVSLGIPVLATSAGGIPELVNDSCGTLLELHPAAQTVASAIENILQSDWNNQQGRTAIRQYWEKSVFANVNRG